MASIKFLLQSKNSPANIYLRLSIDRQKTFKRKTGYVINIDDWSTKTGMPKNGGDEEQKKRRGDIENKLNSLSSKLKEKLNDATANGIDIDGKWLQKQIDDIQNKKQESNLDLLVNYFQYYIDNLPFKTQRNNTQGVTERTTKKYRTVKKKIAQFEEYSKKTYQVRDVNLRFRNDLIKYLKDVDKLSVSTVGRYVKCVKTVCLNARVNEIETHPHLLEIKGFTDNANHPFLSFEELNSIQEKDFDRDALMNAKDWLLIGCYIGQRVSDLLELTSQNIQMIGGYKMIVLTQRKTKKEVAIPIHEKIKTILEKRNWNFPERISAQKFNLHIKDVVKGAGINEPISGGKMNKKTKRKDFGIFEKWELATSHICRRSFATNFYAETPTALLINITAHSTEKQFLEYIGKPAKDFSVQLADYWSKESLKAKKQTQLNVLKTAN
ncbi:tyrosine-type recombinase/integrase [Maribellus sediminis]|uniref:tyrosine-type recombinase/integrase n=1 Tax=Maribellus sediminis TaxID=2696285 RepID=UPI0014317993|nr:tyrosine-type recombinase/integrase [Maribellus sediminis]